MTARNLLIDMPVVGKGSVLPCLDSTPAQRRSIQATVSGIGAVSATVRVYGCNDARHPIAIMDMTLSGTGFATDADVDDFPWENYQAEVLAISGTEAKVTVIASV